MSSISSINTSSYMDYGRIASGRRVQSAADGAAELSIIQKQDAQARGYKAAENNIGAASDLLKVADGAAAGITDYLQRIRELAVQASNTATMTDADRESIQAEIEQMKAGITDIASNTTYNTKPLLDGSESQLGIATDSGGKGMNVELPNALVQELGIADFDVTGDFNISDIDKALSKVSAGRSSMGAQSNALEYAFKYTTNAKLNTIGAKSRLEDLDIPEAISEKKKQETLQEYAMFMQRRKMEDEAMKTRMFFI